MGANIQDVIKKKQSSKKLSIPDFFFFCLFLKCPSVPGKKYVFEFRLLNKSGIKKKKKKSVQIFFSRFH